MEGSMSGKQDTEQPGTEVAPYSQGLVAKFAKMVTLLPAEDAGGAERIMEQILEANSWEDLNSPWESSKASQLAGKILRIDRAERRPSDFRDGLGFFIVVHGVDTATGEKTVVVTSATAVIAQIVRAYAIGAMPIFAEFVISERATKDGYHPHHLKIHGSAAPVTQSDAHE